MSEHFVKKCKYCRVVIVQCRCMGPKVEEIGICDACKKAIKHDESLMYPEFK